MRVRPLKRRVSSMPGTKKISPTPGHDQIADRVGAIFPSLVRDQQRFVVEYLNKARDLTSWRCVAATDCTRL